MISDRIVPALTLVGTRTFEVLGKVVSGDTTEIEFVCPTQTFLASTCTVQCTTDLAVYV